MTSIYGDREPADLRPRLDAAGVRRVVVVQAAETLAETLFTIGLARKFAWIAGVVGWVELASPAICFSGNESRAGINLGEPGLPAGLLQDSLIGSS